jgi:hypothetical protein
VREYHLLNLSSQIHLATEVAICFSELSLSNGIINYSYFLQADTDSFLKGTWANSHGDWKIGTLSSLSLDEIGHIQNGVAIDNTVFLDVYISKKWLLTS